ncbi:diacylglycerol kinase [Zobellella iuensis]|uniref:Diacylglycerol kinase n=1 Tax=Zobellella iuensis TaxID=2803811 RepID=A0ABS1QT81_9GAMM|nr:diacylglycerol kinase [Zobellella iuensis]MBL1378050.1 diacylglycerol kinase [Zobellella iuensis]
MKPGKTGLTRIISAGGYSLQGLKSAYRNEAAFRQECWLAAVLLPLACWWDVGLVARVLLIGSLVLVLVVELLNSAVEAVVDRIGPEHHELAGRAKDMGSAAVLLALLLAALTWVLVFIDYAF